MNDLEIIRQLEEVSGIKLKTNIEDELTEYYIAENGRVINICIAVADENLSAVYSLLAQLKALDRLTIITHTADKFLSLGVLSQVSSLSISYNHITGISYLQDWRQLKELFLTLNHLGDLYLLDISPDFEHPETFQTKLNDLSPLARLKNLTELSFEYNNIQDIAALAELKNLKILRADFNSIEDITPIKNLTQLTELSFPRNPVSNISPLKDLKYLSKLDLSITKVTDISPLKNLTGLTDLFLSKIPLSETHSLAGLVNLRRLIIGGTEVRDIHFLKNFHFLEHLHLYSNSISDLSPLRGLNNLTKLIIDENPITDLSELKHLPNLKTLRLRSNQITNFDADLLKHLPYLEKLELSDNPIKNIPPHLFDTYSNCLQDVRNFFSSLTTGKTATFESKLILVGNGRVGKTCLVKRWLDNTFDANEPSTHAIQLRSKDFKTLAGHTGLANARLNIWDFGGQDIYHATHRLFMRTQAIFLLVWDAETEKEEWQSEGDIPAFKNQRLSYWLSYIKTLSPGSPVLLVQTKEARDGVQMSPLSEIELKEYNVQGILSIDSSKDFLNGVDILDTKIQQLMARQIEDTCTIFPTSWVIIRQKITALQKKGVRQLPLVKFQALCRKQGLDKSTIHTLLKYFHDSGVFFYQKGLFNDQILLDQKWAIDAVYTLFDRKNLFVHLQKGGLFKGADLQVAWANFTEDEQELFLRFMFQCEICFEFNTSYHRTPFAERTFIAPQLLPHDQPDTVKFAFRKKEGIYYRYKYPFLQPAIIQRFIVRVSRMAQLQNMWRNGIILMAPEGMALVEAFPDKKEILIRLEDHRRSSLLNKIRNEMEEITGEDDSVIESVSLDGETFVNLTDLKDHRAKLSEYSIFLALDEKERFNKPDAAKTVQIFLSSSLFLRSDRERFEQFVGRENKKQKGPFLKLIQCEDFPDHLAANGGLMEAYKQSLLDCNIVVLLYHTKVGKYTDEEFDTAYDSFKKSGRPLIYTYYKDEPLPSNITPQEINSKFAFEEKLRSLGHFPTKYDNLDALINHFKNQMEKYLNL